MSTFWYTQTTMNEIDPDYINFAHFSLEHIAAFLFSVAIIVGAMIFYRRFDDEKRQKFLNVTAILLIADEIWKHAGTLATGQWEPAFLPLHLCSINIFICVWYTLKKNDVLAEMLYALCAPGALIALLMPTWNDLPYWNFMSLHSSSVHILLAMYPMLLIAGGFKPSVKRLPKVSLILLCEAVPIFFINKILDTNFFFLNGTENNPLLELLAGIFGEKLYFIGILPILAVVWAAMYLPWYFTEKKKAKI